MNLTCRRFAILLFLSLVVNTSTGKLTLIQTSTAGNHIHNLLSALLKKFKTPSPSPTRTSFEYVDLGFETRSQIANSSLPLSRNQTDERVITGSNTSHTTHADSGFKGRETVDMLMYVRSLQNGHQNAINRTDSSSSLFSALQSNLILSSTEVNKSEVLHENSQSNSTTLNPLSLDEAGFRPYQNRSRRGAFRLLPESYLERQSFFSASETCRQTELLHVLRPPGCVRRVVRTSSCEGTCHSRSVPHWDIDLQELRHVAYCTCCKPHQLSYRRTRFRCPGRRKRVLVLFVGVATDCACRPCSEGEATLQQPYDY